MRIPPTALIGVCAISAVVVAVGVVTHRAAASPIDAGFWWDQSTLQSPATQATGTLTAQDFAVMQQVSRDEVRRAFAQLRVDVTDHHDAFWKVSVVLAPSQAFRFPSAQAGESHVFGPLGSYGQVGFLILAHNAFEYAPPSASRGHRERDWPWHRASRRP